MKHIEIYDTTLRDGAQSEGISFSVEDKLRITEKLDLLGVHYIEGGWPGANPKDTLFFENAQKLKLKSAQIVAFGSTRRAKYKASQDPTLQSLLHAGTSVVTLFGKSWDFHVKAVLEVSEKKNEEMISDSIAYLKSKGKHVFFDAEHFFDGYAANPDYALKTLFAAEKAGAERLILCDTNGGTFPGTIQAVVQTVVHAVNVPVGIHTHNDAGMAVANALMAVEAGASQVQGTINGFGERVGNANLISVIPNLQLKMGMSCVGNKIRSLQEVSRFVYEIANLPPDKHQPFVGEAAFEHKGGVHVDALRKNVNTYEHIAPEKVGNRRRVLISDYSGRGNLMEKAKEYGIPLTLKSPYVKKILQQLKELEHQGYQFDGADGSFELLMKRVMGSYRTFFDLIGFRVTTEKQASGSTTSEATIQVRVKGKIEHTAAEGNGPVNALDNALKKALITFYSQLSDVTLLDYKVRVLDTTRGTGSKVRVLVESSDGRIRWGTVGVSENVIEASLRALVDSIEYKLLHDKNG